MLTDAREARERNIRKQVGAGVAALDRCWPAWWYATVPLPVHWRRMLGEIEQESGYRLHSAHRRELGFDYFFTDENEAAVAAFSEVIRRRRFDRRGEMLAGLAGLWERDAEGES